MSIVSVIKDAFDVANTDKGHHHRYEYMYGFMFANYEPKTMIEIGVKRAASIAAWELLFPNCRLYGMDVNEVQNPLNKKPFTFIKADSTKYDASDLPVLDVIIDDGSHFLEDQIATFNNLKDKFRHFYVIEDINYVTNSSPNNEGEVSALIKHISSCGFPGIAVFKSHNPRKSSSAIVVLGNSL